MTINEPFVMFDTPEEKRIGLSRMNPVPKGRYFVFPYVMDPGVITTELMKVPIRVYQLDESLKIVHVQKVKPLRVVKLEPQTFHVVESATGTPVLNDFRPLKKMLW